MRLLLYLCFMLPVSAQLNYERMAARIADSLALEKGERVVLRYDPGYFQEIRGPLKEEIAARGGVVQAELPYLKPPAEGGGRLAEALKAADVYLWMPLRDELYVSAAEQQALAAWLRQGGARREIHFHWSGGSVLADGLPAVHPAGFDGLYQAALDIDYKALSARQDRLIAALRRGVLHITTPEGTNLRLRVGARPMNKQDGDASGDRARRARMKVDREIELPAGVVRVAPEEDTVNGTLAVAEARFGGVVARRIRFHIAEGRVTAVEAAENREAVEAELKSGGAAGYRFRELGIGVNPRLAAPAGSPVLPYYGYGDAVVRLSLGDNEELAGGVRGNWHRWFFFPVSNIDSESGPVVRGGRLAIP